MIIRVAFSGITKKDKKRSTLEDHVDLHASDLKEAREIFSSWTKSNGIRGASGVFHPLNGYGDVRIKTVTEVTKTGDLDIGEIEDENTNEAEGVSHKREAESTASKEDINETGPTRRMGKH